MCDRQILKKYTSRPAPPYPANKCPKGEIRLGNDGLEYVNTTNVLGIKAWKKMSHKSKKPSKKTLKKNSIMPLKKNSPSKSESSNFGPLVKKFMLHHISGPTNVVKVIYSVGCDNHDTCRRPTQKEISTILEKDVLLGFGYTIANVAKNIKITKILGNTVFYEVSKGTYDLVGRYAFENVDDDGNYPTEDGRLFSGKVL
jgi:hypothetical protein